MVVDSAGQLGTISSSRKVKDDIADMGEASSLLMRLRPVTFYYKGQAGNSSRTLQYGLIAEEVADIAPELVAHKANGEIETVYYQFLAPMLLNEFQKQQRTIDAQAAALSSQTTRIAELERDRQAQIARVDSLEQQTLEIAALKHQVAQLARRQQQTAGLAKAASRPGPLETAKLAAACSRTKSRYRPVAHNRDPTLPAPSVPVTKLGGGQRQDPQSATTNRQRLAVAMRLRPSLTLMTNRVSKNANSVVQRDPSCIRPDLKATSWCAPIDRRCSNKSSLTQPGSIVVDRRVAKHFPPC